MDLTGKTALVTGGTRGIGAAITRHLASRGAQVAIVGTSLESAEKAKAVFAAEGIEVLALAANVADAAAAAAAVDETVKAFGKLDILVNNAGITRDNLLIRMKEEEWDEVLDANLKGAYNFMKAACRPMMKARFGRIINISSVVGLMGNAGQANYAASKAGLIGLSKSIAKELASRNITVNVVAPGFIQTEMTHDLSDEQKTWFLNNIPLGRAGLPQEVAAVVSFLASDDAAYMTGQTLTVDGGMVMA